MWIAVRRRFTQFHSNLTLTPLQQLDGHKKKAGVVDCLNRHYYGVTSHNDNSFLIGSWAKDTAVRPPRDVDLYFLLPHTVYHRFQGHTWNRQSALLQEVKRVLTATYPNTDMRGDGQVVLVSFGSYNVEVVPAFALYGNGYWICDTHNGGSYKTTQPWLEVDHIDTVNRAVNGQLRPLIRMLKVWQEQCSVPIKSFQLELVSADFILESPWRHYDFWFDWIVRDFFAYLYHRAYTFVTVPGTSELIPLGADWQGQARSAYNRALKACYYEKYNVVKAAGEEWHRIFGSQIPEIV